MKRLAFAIFAVCVLAGCRHGDIDSAWTEVRTEDGFRYLAWEQGASAGALIAVFPGYGGGYETETGDVIRKRMTGTKAPGTVILPYMEYRDPAGAEFAQRKVVETIGSIPHSGLSLAGCSAGASFALGVSGELAVEKLLLLSAGAYEKTGGKPSDELPFPSAGEILFIEGYRTDVLRKYGILYDGTVFVDPAKRLADETGADIILLPDVGHGDTVRELRRRPEITDWLANP